MSQFRRRLMFLKMFVTTSHLAEKYNEYVKHHISLEGGTLTKSCRTRWISWSWTRWAGISTFTGKLVACRAWTSCKLERECAKGLCTANRDVHAVYEPTMLCSTTTRDDETANSTCAEISGIKIIVRVKYQHRWQPGDFMFRGLTKPCQDTSACDSIFSANLTTIYESTTTEANTVIDICLVPAESAVTTDEVVAGTSEISKSVNIHLGSYSNAKFTIHK